MRSLVPGLIALSIAPAALAADFGDTPLRGSQSYLPGYPGYFNWSGVYLGAQAGWSVAHGDMTQMTTLQSLSDSHSSASYGAFAGYNVQWENAILGAEINYNHTQLRMFDSLPPGVVSIAGTVSAEVTDYATLRGRGFTAQDDARAPLLVFGLAAAVGPPWLITSTGGREPGRAIFGRVGCCR